VKFDPGKNDVFQEKEKDRAGSPFPPFSAWKEDVRSAEEEGILKL
jgi:hypothetical protein